jgi:signal transduction histidine kinase
VAQSREGLDEQISVLRRTVVRSFGILGLGLIVLAALQAFYGLWPLRRVRQAIAAIRSGEKARIDERYPREIEPLTEELNALLVHNEVQAEEARRHAGNLAHALKTPLTVDTNAAAAKSPDLAETVRREAATMRRQVDHHLARARAIGRRSSAHARADVWPALQSVERAVSRLHNVTIDLAGDKKAVVRVERQDLDEMLGNLMENGAKYGSGRVFVTVKTTPECVEIEVEDDGPGIPLAERTAIFDRGARLDTGKPGTGLGLAIVRDVAQIYEGSVHLEESEDLGGLLARLKLPLAP